MSNKLIRNGFSVIEMIYRVICKANPGFERKYVAEDLDIVSYNFKDDGVSTIDIKFRRGPRDGSNNNYNINTVHTFNCTLPTMFDVGLYYNLIPPYRIWINDNDLSDIKEQYLNNNVDVEVLDLSPEQDRYYNSFTNGVRKRFRISKLANGSLYTIEKNGIQYKYPPITEFIRNGTHNDVIFYKHVFTEPAPMPEAEIPEL